MYDRILHCIKVLLISGLINLPGAVKAQKAPIPQNAVVPVQSYVSTTVINGKKHIQIIKDSTVKGFDEATYAKVKGVDLKDGTIELKVLSRLMTTAPEFARGFIGIAFRVNDDNTRFECIYLRPTNGRAEDQRRRNGSIQYFAFPEYQFERLRKEAPGYYESYADMTLNQWIKMKIVINGSQAKLYLNDQPQPSLIVNDLKNGSDSSGGIALWVDVGTEGYFSDLKVTPK